MNRIAPQMLVRNSDGRTGVTCEDFPPPMDCCGPKETPVVYEGTSFIDGTPTDALEVIGPENAVADLKKCGGGKGEQCCIFLVGGPEGMMCERFGNMRNVLIFRVMGAKRHPEELFPACQFPD